MTDIPQKFGDVHVIPSPKFHVHVVILALVSDFAVPTNATLEFALATNVELTGETVTVILSKANVVAFGVGALVLTG